MNPACKSRLDPPLRLLSLLVFPVPISLHSLPKSQVLRHRGSLGPEPAVALPPDGVADALRTEVALLLRHDLVHLKEVRLCEQYDVDMM